MNETFTIIREDGSEDKVSLKNLIQIPSIDDASEALNAFYRDIKLEQIEVSKAYENYIWSSYDKLYNSFAIRFFQYQKILELCEKAPIDRFDFSSLSSYRRVSLSRFLGLYYPQAVAVESSNPDFVQRLLEFVTDITLAFYSLFSILFCKLFHRGKIVIWSGDYLDSRTKFEPRLGDFPLKMKLHSHNFIECIRTDGVSRKQTLLNLLKRKRPLIYYNELTRIFLKKKTFERKLIQVDPGIKELFFIGACRFINANKAFILEQERRQRCFELLYRFLKSKVAVVWFQSSRTSPMILAGRKKDVKTIGFMHGIVSDKFMGHEYLKELTHLKIGPDVYGVWSSYWYQEFLDKSALYNKSNLEVCGSIKPLSSKVALDQRSSARRVVFVAETHLDPEELVPYLKAFSRLGSMSMALKIRPFGTDKFYQRLLSEYPKLLKEVDIVALPVEEAFSPSDLVVGSHSTVLLEAARMGISVLFINTKKWGDFFNLTHQGEYSTIFCQNSDNISEELVDNCYCARDQLLVGFVERMFGSGSLNGAPWLTDKCRSML